MSRRQGFAGFIPALLLLIVPAWTPVCGDDVILFQAEPAVEAEAEDDADSEDVTREISVEVKQDGKTLAVTQTVDGVFVGEIDDGAEQTPVKAESLQELKEKFPEVHAAFTAKPANPAAQAGAPVGISVQVTDNNGDRKVEIQEPGRKTILRDQKGEDISITVRQDLEHGSRTERYEAPDVKALRGKYPAMARLFQQHQGGAIGGAINLQVQAGGGVVFGNAGAIGGPRKISGEQDGRKVVIHDENGRRIRIAVTKTVDGDEATEEFEADDLANLRKKHPDVAKLYEKLAGKGGYQRPAFGNVAIGAAAQPNPARAVPPPVEGVKGTYSSIQFKLARMSLEQSLRQLKRLADDPKIDDQEAVKKLADEITEITKKLEDLETKAKK